MKYTLIFIQIAVLLSCKAQTTITPEQAKDNIGNTVTVCGIVVNSFYDGKAHGKPTFIDFGAKYPNNTFEVVIWAENLTDFSFKPTDLIGKNVCVTAPIKLYNGKPEMIIKYPDQIKVQ